LEIKLHCFLHRAPIQLFSNPQAFSHPCHITSSRLFIHHCSDFKTVLSPFESLPQTFHSELRSLPDMVRQHFAIFSELPAPSVATRRIVGRISRVGHVTWHVYVSVGRRRDAAGKGASAALCSRWEFRSHASRRFVSRRRPDAIRETTVPYIHITCAHVQSRAVRLDTKLCWIACRDPRVT